jgi:hypothetical protein
MHKVATRQWRIFKEHMTEISLSHLAAVTSGCLIAAKNASRNGAPFRPDGTLHLSCSSPKVEMTLVIVLPCWWLIFPRG